LLRTGLNQLAKKKIFRILGIETWVPGLILASTWQVHYLSLAINEKLVLSPCFVKHRSLKTYGEVKLQLHEFLNPALDWFNGKLYQRGRNLMNDYIELWMGRRAGMESVEKRQIIHIRQETSPDSPLA
jgi:hypothetical protein